MDSAVESPATAATVNEAQTTTLCDSNDSDAASPVQASVTVLQCHHLLAMAKTWRADGSIANYSNAGAFKVTRQPVEGIEDLSALMTTLEGDPRACVIRGELRADAPEHESRAGHYRRNGQTFDDAPRQWLAFDVDDFVPMLYNPVAEPARAIGEFLRDELPEFANTSHHWQLTGKAGHPDADDVLKARLWFWLAEPRTSAQLKAWTQQQWPEGAPFDKALFSPYQVHYTAAPVFEPGATNPVTVRSGLSRGEHESVFIPEVASPTAHQVGRLDDISAGRMTAYVERTLAGIDRDIANAPSGDRNNRLYQKARRAFSLVHTGQAEEGDVRARLEDAAINAGLDDDESAATLDSAWQASQREPDDVGPAPEPARPSFATYEQTTDYGPPGLYYHGLRYSRKKDDAPAPYDQQICSPIHVEATTSDERGENFGRLLKFRNTFGQWRQWAMPMRLLSGKEGDWFGELLGLGAHPAPDANKLLHQWLMQSNPERRLVAATRVGWHTTPEGRTFVMPRRTIGGDGVVFQSEYATHDEFSQKGTADQWREEVGALCPGNPLLLLAVSAALAGPLLELTNRPGAGLHFIGKSSSGKSTLLQVAGSVWGSNDFIRTWRATSNGLEGISASQSDTCLILDEIGEADPREVGKIVYAIANGTGKTRAARTGGARAAARWRVALLSSGERSLTTHMAEGGKQTRAGQEVRMLDLPAQRTHGVYDELHHLPGGRALSDHLKTAVGYRHGHLGPAFIEQLLGDERDFPAMLDEAAKHSGFASQDGLEGRAATSLALIGMAGELATEYGLTGWPEGEAMEAAVAAFDAWRGFRGQGQTETRQILQAVDGFITRHGDSRFSGIAPDPMGSAAIASIGNVMVRERAGWWRDDDAGRIYLFTSEGLREALQGFDFQQGLAALEEAGWIANQDQGRRSKKVKIEGSSRNLYAIRPLDEDAG